MPDYSLYYLHELKDALNHIDEVSQPDEAKIIRELIEKGGYINPADIKIEKVYFSSVPFKWFLVCLFLFFSYHDIVSLIDEWNLFVISHLLVTVVGLVMIFVRHRYVSLFIKIWSILTAISALFGFVSLVYATYMSLISLFNYMAVLLGSIYILIVSDRYIKLVPNDQITQAGSGLAS